MSVQTANTLKGLGLLEGLGLPGLAKLALQTGCALQTLGLRELTTLLLLKRLLSLGSCLVIPLRQTAYDSRILLLCQPAFQFCTLNAFAAAAKSSSAHSLCLQVLARDVALTVDLTN